MNYHILLRTVEVYNAAFSQDQDRSAYPCNKKYPRNGWRSFFLALVIIKVFSRQSIARDNINHNRYTVLSVEMQQVVVPLGRKPEFPAFSPRIAM